MTDTKDSRKVETTRLSIEKYKEHLLNMQKQNEETQRIIELTQNSGDRLDPLNETSVKVNFK